MKIGIQPDQIGNESYSTKWAEFLQKRGVEFKYLNLLANDAFDQVKGCDGIMWRWFHNPQDKQSAQRLLFVIEKYLAIPVFPDTSTSWHFDEKIAQYYLLTSLGMPMPKTRIIWKYEEAIDWAIQTEYPVVFKLSCGASSANVMKIENKVEALSMIEKMFRKGIFPSQLFKLSDHKFHVTKNIFYVKAFFDRIKHSKKYLMSEEYPPLPEGWWWKPEFGYIYIQEYITDNDFDTRIVAIGDCIFGFRRFNRPNDFRASGSGIIDNDPTKINPECLRLAMQISKQAGFQSMAYDFLFDKEVKPVISEISYTYRDEAVYQCPGHWNSELNWIDGQMWPEEAQVDMFIDYINSR